MKRRIAILATHGFEESELVSPKEYIEAQGWVADIISPESGTIRSWDKKEWGRDFAVNIALEDAWPGEYDALVLPGGVINPDLLRTNQQALAFIKYFFAEGKPVAAICHGPQILINAEVVRGRTLTSYPSIKEDLINAGADWVDQEVVSDHGLITSRSPADLAAFNKKLVQEIKEGKHFHAEY